MNKPKRIVKYSDRCGSPHPGSSTCVGCDPAYWLNDDPYRKKDLKTTSEIIADILKEKGAL